MVEFAGYNLPVLYEKDNGGVMAEHHQTRERAGIFDVSHMGQIKWHGDDCADFIEKCVVGDVKGLEVRCWAGDGRVTEGRIQLPFKSMYSCNFLAYALLPPHPRPLPPPSPEPASSRSLLPPREPSLTTASCPRQRKVTSTWLSMAPASTRTWPTSRSRWRSTVVKTFAWITWR